MNVDFQYWEYEIPSELLTRYGSPHFSDKEAGGALVPKLTNGANRAAQHRLSFTEGHILCANEAFPEAAVADPLADLRVWDEWCSGSRRFPYPGRFSRLGLTHQAGKTSSPSSVGVLGEIMAGVFAQAFVGPQVMVRCIRHWPDLIFHVCGDLFGFVEAKAFTGAKVSNNLGERIPDALLRELVVLGVRQLNADPHLDIWGAFTGIVQIQPQLNLTVTMVRLGPPDGKRRNNPRLELPLAVVKGVAERAVARAALQLDPTRLQVLGSPGKLKVARTEIERVLLERALREIDFVLTEAVPKVAVEASRGLIEAEVKKLIRGYQPSEVVVGKRFFEIKSGGELCSLQKVRCVGQRWLFMADLGAEELELVESRWESNWENAIKPLCECDGNPAWRCGGAAYCYGPESLEYQMLQVH